MQKTFLKVKNECSAVTDPGIEAFYVGSEVEEP